MANKFKKGDNVIVITGSDKGKIGKILSIDNQKVVVEGVNVATVHQKPSSQQPGEIKKIEKAINISNISPNPIISVLPYKNGIIFSK